MQAKTPCSICNQETADADVVTIQRVASKDGIAYYIAKALAVANDRTLSDPNLVVLPSAACRKCVAAWTAADPTLPAHLALGAADKGSFIAPSWQKEKAKAPAGYVH